MFFFISCDQLQRQINSVLNKASGTAEQTLRAELQKLKDRLSDLKDDDYDEIEDLEDEIADLEEQLEDLNSENQNINVDDYLPTAVYFSMLNAHCDSASRESGHTTCVVGCITTHSTNPTAAVACIENDCDDANCTTYATVGSGVFQDDDHVLTNHHVIQPVIGYTENSRYHFDIVAFVENYSKQTAFIDAIKWHDTKDDIALVELLTSLSNAEVPDFGSFDNLKLLDTLFTIGAPGGEKWTTSLGRLTNKDPAFCRNCIATSIPTGGGNSGGPIFNRHGELVALHAGRILSTADGVTTPFQNLAFGPHIDRIQDLIDSNQNGDVTNVQSSLLTEAVLSSESAQEKLAEQIIDIIQELED